MPEPGRISARHGSRSPGNASKLARKQKPSHGLDRSLGGRRDEARSARQTIRCAIYTRKSSEEGLEQDFNSLHAQREACEAYVLSQRHEGWTALPQTYDDGGFSGGSLQRPAVQRLLADIEAGLVDCVVVYKVDRLTRSLSDFARMVEVFDERRVSFVSVTQAFNTTSSMGRLTLNVLLSFAQFEREVTGERIRDKIAASKKKGLWMGGWVPLGYRAAERTLAIDEPEAEVVRTIYRLYLELGNVRLVEAELSRHGVVTKRHTAASGRVTGGGAFSRGHLYKILANPLYRGDIVHKGTIHKGQHPAIVDLDVWDEVQASLSANGHARRVGRNATQPSLLAGLLFDMHGRAMKPVHANKSGRRYRYYASAASDEVSALRLSASAIEQAATKALTAALADEPLLADWIGEGATIDEIWQGIAEVRKLVSRLTTAQPEERRAAMLASVERIEVARDTLAFILRREGLFSRSSLGNETASQDEGSRAGPNELGFSSGPRGDTGEDMNEMASDPRGSWDRQEKIVVEVPVTLVRRGGETKLVLSSADTSSADVGPDRSLLKAIARAHGWWTELSSGRAASLTEIAEREGLTDRAVGQIVGLAFLRPSLVEAVLSGAETELPSARALTLSADIPLLWDEQGPALARSASR